jgi:hypothetical protein
VRLGAVEKHPSFTEKFDCGLQSIKGLERHHIIELLYNILLRLLSLLEGREGGPEGSSNGKIRIAAGAKHFRNTRLAYNIIKYLPRQDASSRISRSHLVRHVALEMCGTIVDQHVVVGGGNHLQVFKH